MALTAALKAQIAAWYKALPGTDPGLYSASPAAADDRRCGENPCRGREGRHLAIEAPTGVGKTLSYLIPGIAIAREEQKTLVVSTANVALQDQIYSKDLPLLRKIIPDLRFYRRLWPRTLRLSAQPDGAGQHRAVAAGSAGLSR